MIVMVVVKEVALKAALELAPLDALDAQVIVLVLVVMAVRVALVHVVENVKINVVLVQDAMVVVALVQEVVQDLVLDAITVQALANLIVLVVLLIVPKDVMMPVQHNVHLVANQIVMLLAATLVKQFHQV